MCQCNVEIMRYIILLAIFCNFNEQVLEYFINKITLHVAYDLFEDINMIAIGFKSKNFKLKV